MKSAPSLDDVFAVMAMVSIGNMAARVAVPEDANLDDLPTRVAIGLNVLLDDLALRFETSQRLATQLGLLTEASRDFFSGTSDPEALLREVARRLATSVKDTCAVLLLSKDGRELVPVAIHGPDEVLGPTREAFREPLLLEHHPILREVQETGRPFLAPHLDLEQTRQLTTAGYHRLASRIGLHSFLVVPLRLRDAKLGQVMILRHRAESGPFSSHDVDLASGLADHAALAIDSARAQEELRASEARYRVMFDNSPLPKWLYDAETRQMLAVNETAVRLYGYAREQFTAMRFEDLGAPEDAPAIVAALHHELETSHLGVWRHRTHDGSVILVEVTSHALALHGRACRIAVGYDVTEQTRLEEQLRQAQKMEAVGRLAGGVAHDFNNILAVILGYSEALLRELEPGRGIRADIEQIHAAGKRAADLIRQLLAFSRQQVLDPKIVAVNEVLGNMSPMLRRLLGEDVELVLEADPSLGNVRVDPGSLEQVILNLVVNARDAMPNGGKLVIATGNVSLDEAYARTHLGTNPGRYVKLAVIDTGIGMDRQTQARLFEPFFTTKQVGKGTGLGLSTVFGIVRQCGGGIAVESEPGRGATFQVYLPHVDGAAEVSRTAPPPAPQKGSETILLVEDNDPVRRVVRQILEEHGYQVLEARVASEALRLCADHAGTIHLMVTDVVMPEMSGPELAKRVAVARGGTRVLFMSGYADDSAMQHGIKDPATAYLQKPFTTEALTGKVRELLDQA